jgi:hypothetical protein
MSTSKEKVRYKFNYDLGVWVEKNNPEIKKKIETKNISEERFLKAYLRTANKGGCQLDIIKNYAPWMSKEDLNKRIKTIKKNCIKNGYQLAVIPVHPIIKQKPKVVRNIDYNYIAQKFPKHLRNISDNDDIDAMLDPTDIRENRSAYKEALAEHQRRLEQDIEYKRWHESMSKEESKRTFYETFVSRKDE